MENNENKLIYAAALTYTFIIGFSFLSTKIALTVSSPLDILAYRFTTAFLAVLVLIILKFFKLNYNIARIKRIIPLALLYPMLFFALQTFGLQYATSVEAAIMSASAPIFTLILARIFLNEKTNILQKISIVTSVSGVIFITLMKGADFEFNNIIGITLLLLSNISLAGYSVMARILTRDFSNIELSFMMIIISFITFNTMAIGRHLLDGSLANFIAPLFSLKFIIAIAYLGVLSSLVTSILTNYILSKIEASKMSVFSNLGTVISIVAGVLFLKEKLYYYHIIGSILIISGVIGTNFLDKIKLFHKH